MLLAPARRLFRFALLSVGSVLASGAACAAGELSFAFSGPIAVGAALDDANVDQFTMEPLFLGVEFDEPINAGGIIGSANTVITPEVTFLGETVIPAIRADTRTGARLEATISGRAGLELNAQLDLGGLEPDAAFTYTPTLDTPDEVRRGQFFTLRGAAGLDTGSAFGVQQVDLPSASVGADVIFDVDARGRIDYAVPLIVPYNSQPFSWDIARQPTDDDGNWTLFGVGVDLDNDNDFATLTVAGQDIGIDPGENGTLFEYEISLDAPGEGNGSPSLFNRDVGSIQIAKPTLGETLFVDTSLSAERGVQYSIETDLVRLGVDIDGIASTLVAGASYTDFSKTIGQEDSDINGSIDGTIIDLKYGPELGYRYESSIDATFDATLTFSENVALRHADGTSEITDTYTGDWRTLPEIALLGNQAVDVDVAFTRYEARRTDRGALTIGDFLEFEALALSASINVGPLSKELVGIGPAIHERTSLISGVLGKAEIPLFENNDVFLVEAEIEEFGSFTLQAEPSQVLYLAGDNALDVASWRVLGTNETPTTFAGNTLVFGRDGATASHAGELTPTTEIVEGRPTTIVAGALMVVPDSLVFSQTLGSIRRYEVDRITNDGVINIRWGMQLAAGPSGVLRIGGSGVTRAIGRENSPIEAEYLIVEEGHDLFVGASSGFAALDVTQQFVNAGVVRIDVSSAPMTFARGLINTGRININRSMAMNIFGDARIGEGLVNDGVISVRPDATFEIGGSGSLGSTEETSRFDVQGTLLVRGALIPEGKLANFVAADGGLIRFDRPLSVAGDANFTINEGGRLALNGLETFDGDLNDDLPPGRVSIVNRGVLEFEGGLNTVSSPGDEPALRLIDLDNSEGLVHVRPGAIGRVSATIEDYAGGGAVFDAGEWFLEGDPAIFDARNLFSAPGAMIADFFITVQQVNNADTYLGGVDFDGQAYNLEDYDTSIAINASNVTLSGAAYFSNLNTIRENRGVLNLREGIRFSTDGELLNSGEINVENGARLTVNGDLLIHGGALRVDGRSGLELIDFAVVEHDFSQHKIEVIGGDLVFGNEGFLQLFLAQTLQPNPDGFALIGDWTVSESVVVDPNTGVEAVTGSLVDLGVIDRITTYGSGRLVLDGAAVTFDAIQGLARLARDSTRRTTLEVLGGFELNVENNLLDPVEPGGEPLDAFIALNETSLLVDAGGKLRTDKLLLFGDASIGEQGYVAASVDTLVVSPVPGEGLRVDGVLETPLLSVLASGEGISGPGELSGAGSIAGDVVVDGGVLTPGADADGLEIFGDLLLSSTTTTRVALGADGHGRLRVGSATLGGLLEVLVGEGFAPIDGELFELVGLLEEGAGVVAGAFDAVALPTLDFATLEFTASDEAVWLQAVATQAGDFNLDGIVDAADYTVWRDGVGVIYEQTDYDAWMSNFGATARAASTVPEPAAAGSIGILTAAVLCWRRRAG